MKTTILTKKWVFFTITIASGVFAQDFFISQSGRFCCFVQMIKCRQKLKASAGWEGDGSFGAPEEGISTVPRDLQVELQGRRKHRIIFGSNTRLKFPEIPRGPSRL